MGKVSAPPVSGRMPGEFIERMARQHGISKGNMAYVFSKWERYKEDKKRRSRSQVAWKKARTASRRILPPSSQDASQIGDDISETEGYAVTCVDPSTRTDRGLPAGYIAIRHCCGFEETGSSKESGGSTEGPVSSVLGAPLQGHGDQSSNIERGKDYSASAK